MPAHKQTAGVRDLLARQTLESCALSGPCHAEQGEALSILQTETQVVYSFFSQNVLLGKLADGQRGSWLLIVFLLLLLLGEHFLQYALFFFLWVRVDDFEELARGKRIPPILLIIARLDINLVTILPHVVHF